MTNGSIAPQRRRPVTRVVSSRVVPLTVGARVCVLEGAWEGLKGVVFSIKDGCRYVLTLDGLPPGVYVAVERMSLAALSE